MASKQTELRAADIDNLAKLGDRSVQNRGSGYQVSIHAVAVANLDIDSSDDVTQYLDAEHDRIIIEKA